jgi:RES domain-containing protein
MIAVNDVVHVKEIPDAEWDVVEASPTEVRLNRKMKIAAIPPLLSFRLHAVVHLTEHPDQAFRLTSITRRDLRLKPVA